MAEFQCGDINAVLNLVRKLTAPDDGDAQLSILTLELVAACRSCGVPKEEALPIITEAFDEELKMAPLDVLNANLT